MADIDDDGIMNCHDLDSDNDGIPDNIEAQATTSYNAPNGGVNAFGLDTAYTPTGLTPVDTDGDSTADYLDTNSDNEDGDDTIEAGLTLAGSVGTNGMIASSETSDDYSDVNGLWSDPSTFNSIAQIDTDGDGEINWRDPYPIIALTVDMTGIVEAA